MMEKGFRGRFSIHEKFTFAEKTRAKSKIFKKKWKKKVNLSTKCGFNLKNLRVMSLGV